MEWYGKVLVGDAQARYPQAYFLPRSGHQVRVRVGYMSPVAYRLKEMGLKAGGKKVNIWHKDPLQNSIPVQSS